MEQNLSAYKIFYTVATTKNISNAAKELYISQPAISKSIAKLEDNLSVKLFHRNSRGVTLTQEGEVLYDSIKQAFASIQEGEDNIRKINQLGLGSLRIGVSTTLCKYILLPYLKEFILAYPHIKIIIECQSTLQTIELLEEGKLDIGFVGKPKQSETIKFTPTTSIEDVFVTAPSYLEHLLLREDLTLSPSNTTMILQASHLMLLDEHNLSRIYIDDYLRKHQIETNHILQVSNMDLLIEFAKIGLGVSCVIKEFVEKELEHNELHLLPLKKPMKKRDVGFAYSSSKHMSTSLLRFLDFYQIE